MDYWQFDLLAVALPALLLLGRRRPHVAVVRATLLLAAVALVWTAPWDEHLIRSGVWSYGAGRVLGLVGRVPAEEYAFVVLLVALVAAWGTRTGLLAAPRDPEPAVRTRTGGAGWLIVTLLGAVLVAAGGHARYLGLLLVWAGPPLALQHAVAGDLLAPRWRARLALVLPVALWLAAADRLALADGVWTVAPGSSTGLLLLGLPVEEALFFLLAAVLVADGLLLALDPRALHRALALVPGTRPPVASAPRVPVAPPVSAADGPTALTA